MSLQNYRFPLSDYSNARMNRLELFGGSRLAGATKTTSMTTLPSIKSLINHTSVDDNQMNLTPRYHHHQLHTLPSVMTEPLLVRSHSLPIPPLRNYGEISKKLKVRLQFAYYKYKTKQSDLNFADLKRQHILQKSNNVNKRTSRKGPKRRKLVVSQGNYRTPSKKHTTQPLLCSTATAAADETFSRSYNTCVDSSVSTTTIHNNNKINNINNSGKINLTTMKNHNDTTVVNTMTTPIRDQQKLSFLNKQETPMSVKAAKSLMHLFTSSNQF
ncbi:similar to Saccharomyces cerevisiae YNR009W NRM1 Transcriptional co-repressor of MBF (MCB binding factor)-regulated gene expression [Maudiozyma saulgeensis]|uniref:Similar to Saccharomyces cerevisiae YNR009W NRM1 Transcriptional co-repressor of MBF (MCB binding factor)-regulated gene expression n=1 Tax=Maudiozyma saulgeensis TaxID=1789683 RepID=A0A1X7R7Y6_9SACH|nr:similar to Saccharomyces cerevisiae YNR009W NRM1 Transcriptional co-repressor of MBF (MCB binding factor)-regulated gene expression [Kazachstania saulgeensis]